jgi:hypothetical protein
VGESGLIVNFVVEKCLNVKVKGQSIPAKIKADQIEDSFDSDGNRTFMFKQGDNLIGEFKASSVDGWWMD